MLKYVKIQPTYIGAFIQNKLVGYAGFYIYSPIKLQHKACLFSLYTNENYRNKGIGNTLIKAVIDHLMPYVLQLHVNVTTSNQTAIRVYEKNGFKCYGIAPRSLKVNEQLYDEHHMILMPK